MGLFNRKEHKERPEDFTIDRFHLEVEADKQSELMEHYGRKLAYYSALEKEAKRKLEYVQAECAEIIRNNPKQYGLEKTTDTVVYRIALNEPDYVREHDGYREILQMKLTYEAAVKALAQKGSMIKELVKLWLNDYYSEPTVYASEAGPNQSIQKHRLKRLFENE